MANQFYEKVGGQKIREWQVVREYIKADIEGDIIELKELEALSDGTKEQLLNKAPDLVGGNPNPEKTLVQNFDDVNRKKREQLQDVRDYWNLDTAIASGIDEVQTSWVSLSSLAQGSGSVIQSVCGEDVGDESARAIDGQLGTFWQHDLDEKHSITLDMTYPKVVDGVRLWIPNANLQFQLSNVVLTCSTTIGGLSSPDNIIGSGISLTGNGTWAEYSFPAGKKRARYLKLSNMDSDHATNEIRIREVEVSSIPKFFSLEGD